MNRYIALIITLFSILFATTDIVAKDKVTKKKAELRPQLPMPETIVTRAQPQKPLAPVAEIGSHKLAGSATSARVVASGTGVHIAQQRGGIDVSHYNGQIDWNRVARNGKVLYAICKATENTSMVDNTFNYNTREARKAGIPVGSYHFFTPNVSGKAQFEHFKRTVDMNTQDVITMLDVEVRGKEPLEEFHRKIREWLDAFEAEYHYKPMIYTSLNFYNKYLAGPFDDYIWMIAKYGEGAPNPKNSIPFATWQYTSNGVVEGINHRTDLSCFMDHYDLKDILIKTYVK